MGNARNKPKNRIKPRPHSSWLTVPIEWKQVDSESFSLVGYASMWGGPPDEHGDIITQGAFRKTIKERVVRGLVPLLDSHIYDSAHTIGTVVKAEEDETGLKIWARLSQTPSAMEIRQKMMEGHIGKLSIGYDSVRERYGKDPGTGKTVRFLDEVKLFEISVVPIPAMDRAQILSVKTVVPFQDLPMTSRDRVWDSTEAEKTVRNAFGGNNLNFTRYRRAFLWFDQDNPEQLGSYKLQIADFIDGRLVAVPRAIFAVAAVLQGARGGVNIPESDQARIRAQIGRYYAKMRDEFDDDSIIPPWETKRKKGMKTMEQKGIDTAELSDDDLQAFFNSVRQQYLDFPQPDNQEHFAEMGAIIVADMLNRGMDINESDEFTAAALVTLREEEADDLPPDETPPPDDMPPGDIPPDQMNQKEIDDITGEANGITTETDDINADINADPSPLSDALLKLIALLDENDAKLIMDELDKGRNKPNTLQGTNRPDEYPDIPPMKNRAEPGTSSLTQRSRATQIGMKFLALQTKEVEN